MEKVVNTTYTKEELARQGIVLRPHPENENLLRAFKDKKLFAFAVARNGKNGDPKRYGIARLVERCEVKTVPNRKDGPAYTVRRKYSNPLNGHLSPAGEITSDIDALLDNIEKKTRRPVKPT